MHRIVNDEALDILFRAARNRPAWLARPVSDTMLRALWELVKLGPVSASAHSTRLLFIKSDEAKSRLGAAIPANSRDTLLTAPVAAIVGHPPCGHPGADRDGTLHAAYLILAARALGLDCGPIWHFDAPLVDRAFFPDGSRAACFLCALGYGDATQPSPDEPGPGFDEACAIL